MKTIAFEDMEKVTGGNIIIKVGSTREEQEDMFRRHLKDLKSRGWTKDSAVQSEIRLNDIISNSLLTSEDIIRIAEEIFG